MTLIFAHSPKGFPHPESHIQTSALERRPRSSGYAYVMALFLVLTVIVGSQVVLRNMVTATRSQREAEAIWRGNQYARAIKMYYHKTGHFPRSQDDLATGVPGIHFLRSEAMKDPMNTEDGAWRFIYTNASGAIIGSVKYGSLQQMALMDMNGGKMPGQPAANGTELNSQSSNQSSSPGIPTSTGSSSTSAPASGGLSLGSIGPGSGNGTGSLLSTSGNFMNNAPAGPQPTGPVTGQVFGGQLIGVGSTVDRTSVRVYKGGTKYSQWEFIWNPIEEQARAIQQGIGAAGAPGGIPGLGLPIANPGGTGPGIGETPGSANGATATSPANNGGDNGNQGPASGTNTSGNPNSETNSATPTPAPSQ